MKTPSPNQRRETITMTEYNAVLARNTPAAPDGAGRSSQTVAFSHYNNLSAQLGIGPSTGELVAGGVTEQAQAVRAGEGGDPVGRVEAERAVLPDHVLHLHLPLGRELGGELDPVDRFLVGRVGATDEQPAAAPAPEPDLCRP